MAQEKTWGDTYKSFSGIDMVATFEMPLPDGSSITKVVGSLATISYSIHNEKMPVRVLGDMNMKNMVFNGRIVAGSMVFIVFDRHWLEFMMKEYLEKAGKTTHYLADEIPPLNITISFANEYGHCARLALYGVTFVNEGMVMSVNDMYTENTFQYYAMDVEYMTPVDTPKKFNKPKNDNVKTDNTKTDRNSSVVSDVPKEKESGQNENTETKKDTFKTLTNQFGQYKASSSESATKELKEQFKSNVESIQKAYENKEISEEEKSILEKRNLNEYKNAKVKNGI